MPRAKRSRIDGEGLARGPSIVPTVRYRDVPAAIDWLCEAFGFEEHRVVSGQDGGLRYAELTFGGGMVMVAPVEESAVGKLMAQPGDVGGVETQICYLYVADARAHYARAKGAGAEILLDIQDQTDSGRGYSCRDPEGHIWNFGTYNPWERQGGWPGAHGEHRGRGGRMLLAVTLIAAVTAAALHEPTRQGAGELALAAVSRVADAVHAAGADRNPAEPDTPTLDELRNTLAKTQAALAAAEQTAQETREQLAQERRARQAAELAAKELSKQAAGTANATATGKAGAEVEAARTAREAAERAAKETRELLGQARGAKEAAERAAKEARDQVRKERRRRAAARAAAVADTAALQPSPYGSP